MRKKRRDRQSHRLNARGGGEASGFSGRKRVKPRSLTYRLNEYISPRDSLTRIPSHPS